MNIQEVIHHLEMLAPPSLQEDYDNSGLITGDKTRNCSGILVSLDCTEGVVKEAISKGCNMIVCHHPIVFKGLKTLSGKNYVERTVILAIKNDISIYAIHTNLDNVLKGVNGKIGEKLGLGDVKILQPRSAQLKKLITFAPLDVAEKLRDALFKAGGGFLGKYSECSFNTEGQTTFKPMEGATPHTGELGKRHEGKEQKIEIIFQGYLQEQLVAAMIENHPYEEVAYDIISLDNFISDVGAGIIGKLPVPMKADNFLGKLKEAFHLKVIRHTLLNDKPISKVAICGGAGSFLISHAIQNQADIYITSDIKYHEFFDADEKLIIADIGHYESEQFTIDLLYDFLKEKSLNFAVLKSEVNTNPVHYFL